MTGETAPTTQSPLLDAHQAAGAELLAYGPPDAPIHVVESFGTLDYEYASLRKACVLFDAPLTGTIEITGQDRLTFLESMLTNKVGNLSPGEARPSFWLNRKGRIVSDLRLLNLEGRTLIACDAHAIAETIATLDGYLFAEDASIADRSGDLSRFRLIGPTAPRLLELALGLAHPPPPGAGLELTHNGRVIVVEHTTDFAEPAFDLLVAREHAPSLWQQLIDLGEPPPLDESTGEPAGEPTDAQRELRLRRAGWLAINVARIEAGAPMFNIDFGPTNLPAETALLDTRVSFTKGCYLGQEVVARMHSLGKPKQTLVALKPVAQGEPAEGMPVAGGQVFTKDDPTGNPIGAVTSSTISPMLGGVPIAFAMLRTQHAEPGTDLVVNAEGAQLAVQVQPALRFWPISAG
ncbi:MAG: glycine cleavage T C-terminal barrel domain-containing protein [Planctomycetota bacterium]